MDKKREMQEYELVGQPTFTVTKGNNDRIDIYTNAGVSSKSLEVASSTDKIEISFTLIPESGIIQPGDIDIITNYFEKYLNANRGE